MFVDQLRLTIAAQKHAKIVEPGDDALKFHTVDKENGDRNFGLSNLIEKRILQILFIGGHWLIVLVSVALPASDAKTRRARQVLRDKQAVSSPKKDIIPAEIQQFR
jgi:hypothetical protein